MAINIMCFGDSNTYGYNPEGGRFERRYPRELAKILGDKYYVVEEGLGGRAASCEDGLFADLCGHNRIAMLVRSHSPLDLLVINLGTNDYKERMSLSPRDIAIGVLQCVRRAREACFTDGFPTPKILLVAPAPINKGIYNCEFGESFGGERGIQKSIETPQWIKQTAEENNCYFLNAGDYVSSSFVDGIHLEEKDHIALAKALAEKIQEIFK
ncbi:MAG: GDSL-type esterase/lipase family protein [Eubacteriales bacterium]|nr:GDSL-type esterase/lipase family protein [Eubacteriales bacterium]